MSTTLRSEWNTGEQNFQLKIKAVNFSEGKQNLDQNIEFEITVSSEWLTLNPGKSKGNGCKCEIIVSSSMSDLVGYNFIYCTKVKL